jgi:Zn-dependent protease
MNEILATITVYAIPAILAITLHEAAHAYAAKYFGDTTAYSQGRMSLNPIVHIDLFGTIIIPAVLFASTGFLFGYAKPVPVNFNNLRKPKRDMAWVALAGPGANLVMAFLWLLFGLLLQVTDIQAEFFYKVVDAGVLTNLLLLAFNLLPIPPLDGGRVLVSLLPHKWAYKVSQVEPYGFMIVIALVLLKVVQIWIVPVMTMTHTVLVILLTPFKLLLGLA